MSCDNPNTLLKTFYMPHHMTAKTIFTVYFALFLVIFSEII